MKLFTFLFGWVRPKSKHKTYKTTHRPSPNQSGTIRPSHIILHHSAGSFEGSVSWCTQSRSRVSYHYMISPTGLRVEMVPPTKKAWHAGKSKWKGLVGMNSHSIGISFYGNTHKRQVGQDEMDSVALLCLELCRKYRIPKDNILTHAMIARHRKDDCSESVWERVKQRMGDLS